MTPLSRDSVLPRTRTLFVAAVLILVTSGGLLAGVSSVAATPWTGSEPTPTNLEFYFHNSTTPITVGATGYLLVMSTSNDTLAPWTHAGAVSVAPHYDSVTFVAAPQFAAPLILNGSIMADVYLNQSGSSLSGGSVVLSVSEISPNGSTTLLGVGAPVGTGALGAGGSIPNVVALPGPTLHLTIPTGDSISVSVSITGTSSTNYGIWWGDVNGTTYASLVQIPVSSYLTVGPVGIRNSTGAAVAIVSQSARNQTLVVNATVFDPIGAYDFDAYPVEMVVTNHTGGVVVGPVAMTAVPAVSSPGAPSANYRASFNYSGFGPGVYNVTVNASDNTQHNTAGQDTLPAYFGRIASSSASITVGLAPVPVYVRAVDDRNHTLVGAVVRVFGGADLLGTNVTNGTGVAGFSVPNGSSYSFRVSWQGVGVGRFTENVTSANSTFLLACRVAYPTFALVTTVGAYPLPFALVNVVHPNGTTLPLIVTDASGTFTLDQVPEGNYTLTVIYDDSEVVSARSVAAFSDGPLFVNVTGVYLLTVQTTDSSGGALTGVDVSVVNASTGATVASGISSGAGPLTFLLPTGVYEVNGYWSTTYDLTAVSESTSVTASVSGPTVVTLSFDKAYPAFTSTNEFWILLGFVAMAAAIAVLTVLWLRRPPRREVAPLTPAPAISPKEGTDTAASKSK